MSDPLPPIVETVRIDAPPATVWRFLVEPAHVARWLGCMRFTGVLGSTFYMQMDGAKRNADDIEGATHCEIVELTEGACFAFTWFIPGSPTTTVRIELNSDESDTTLVTLTHSGWEQFDAPSIEPVRTALAGGWKSHVLPGLKATVESAPPS